MMVGKEIHQTVQGVLNYPFCGESFPIQIYGYFLKWFPKNNNLGGGFKYFLFSSLPGEMIQFD